MARAAILVILKGKNTTGGDVLRQVGSLLGDDMPAGTVSASLASLHDCGCIAPVNAEGDTAATVYAITPAGHACLKKELQGMKKYGRAGARLIALNAKASLQEYRKELIAKREQWRAVRNERLEIKKSMLAKGADRHEIRKSSRYRQLEKEQRHLSMVIKHIEKQLNRKVALSHSEDTGS